MTNKNLDGSNLWYFDDFLAPYAQSNKASQGRLHSETVDPNRLPFQRDRDRIIHSRSFRRLRGKTQVICSMQKGDHFRNRLSHTLEVAQISRDTARQLKLNEDLCESIALAHDLGHPPFGHQGESTLNELLKPYNAHFDHNTQSLRVVSTFENHYEDFRGLNLTIEVLQGMEKHKQSFKNPQGENIYYPHLESQLVDIADEIAYLAADIEDGLRGEFFTIQELKETKICSEIITQYKDLTPSMFVRKLIHDLMAQLIEDSEHNIKKTGIKTLADVQKHKEKIIYFNPDFYVHFLNLKDFLKKRFYQHPEVKNSLKLGEQKIIKVFEYLIKNIDQIPTSFIPQAKPYRRVCDYISGMTEDFLEHFMNQNHLEL